MDMHLPDMKKTKKMMKDARRLQLCASVDAGLRICRKNELHPLKSVALHKSCRVPLLRVLLVTIAIAAALCAAVMIKRKMKSN